MSAEGTGGDDAPLESMPDRDRAQSAHMYVYEERTLFVAEGKVANIKIKLRDEIY